MIAVTPCEQADSLDQRCEPQIIVPPQVNALIQLPWDTTDNPHL